MPTATHRCTHECRLFRLMAWTWCTTYAQQLVDSDPAMIEQAEPCDITNVDSLLGLGRDPDAGTISLIDYSRELNKDYAKTVDLTRPILVIPFGDDDGMWIIDGWHRIWRARSEGLTELPAVLLTQAATELAMVSGPPLPGDLRLIDTTPGQSFDHGDVCEEQTGAARGRRFAAQINAESWAVVDLTFFADRRYDDGRVAAGARRITCEAQWTTCTDPARPDETVLSADVRFETVTVEGPLTSERARELCEQFDPSWIKWRRGALVGAVTRY